jgi:hypothetical protein
MLGAGYWMLDAGYWMLDAGCWILGAGYSGKGQGLLKILRSEVQGSGLSPAECRRSKYEIHRFRRFRSFFFKINVINGSLLCSILNILPVAKIL